MRDHLITDDSHGLSLDFYPKKKHRRTPKELEVMRVNKKAKSDKRRKEVYDRDGHKCLKCGKEHTLTLDHIKPKSKGGSNGVINLQTLCYKCNTEKGDDEIDYRPKRLATLSITID